jgi:hypothetical protein
MLNGYMERQQTLNVCAERREEFPVFGQREHILGLSYLLPEIGILVWKV